MGDCFENESGICIIKTNNVNARKRRYIQLENKVWIVEFIYWSVYKKK